MFHLLRVAQNLADIAKNTRSPRNAPIHPHRAAGGQAADVAEHCIRIGHVSPQEVTDVSRRVGREIDFSAIAQWFYLRSYAKGMAVIGVVERFDSERVAREKET